jgi:hypothetical protein
VQYGKKRLQIPLVLGTEKGFNKFIEHRLNVPRGVWIGKARQCPVIPSLAKNIRAMRLTLAGELIAALFIIVLIFFDGYRGLELVDGATSLVPRKNPCFYVSFLFSIVSPLIFILIVFLGYKNSAYKRNKQQIFFLGGCLCHRHRVAPHPFLLSRYLPLRLFRGLYHAGFPLPV